jgi:deoxyribodipyrimidine photo-lyase
MIQVVWLKRDIRLNDHRPLFEAAHSGPTIVIYVAEPSIWSAGDLSRRHLQFVGESLRDLEGQLRRLGIILCTATAEMEMVLQSIYETFGTFRLLAHEENGAPNTFARDVRVHRWMRDRGLEFIEYQHFGVTRRLKSRDQFQQKWERFMATPLLPAPERMEAPPPELMAQWFAYHFIQKGVHVNHLENVPGSHVQREESQRGGEQLARETLSDFLQHRCDRYQFHISKPYDSMHSCARISTYLAWGNLSMREVVQRTQRAMMAADVSRKRQLSAFFSRLHWHCHFIQRIEDTPHIAHTTMNPAYEGIRADHEELYQAWLIGRTGYPAVDAAMRCLHRTGWLHFRGRAMVVSFVCNTLMLDWRQPAQALAQLFLDYEPGIHYSQMQMQAGTTGFNTIRIYNPVKQSLEHDLQGRFIKMFVPELRMLPAQQLHEPWKYVNPSDYGYPTPIVDLSEANRRARDLLWGVRESSKRPTPTRRKSSPPKQTPEQLSFEFDFDEN